MLLASNAYIYCWNNPIGTADNSGEWPGWITAVAAIATAAVAIAVVVAAAPAAVCAALFTLAYYGVSMATATTVATVGVTAVGVFSVSGYCSDALEPIIGTNLIRDVVLSGSEEKYESYRLATDFAFTSILQAAAMSPGVCFVEGTLISTKEGLELIEEIRVDQQVWAEDPETGERALKRVVRTFLNESDELVHIKVNGETITCTPEHPFYVYNTGWVAAKNLKSDYRLILQSGTCAFVEAVRLEKLAEPITVYNFEVEDFHTYFVGISCVLVHNTCNKSQAKKVNPQEIEDNYGLKKDMFHRVIKPRLLKTVPPNSNIGHNPDIMMDRAGNIAYQPAKGRGFQDTGLNMMDIIGRGNVK